jgi:L-lactate dehydrogenase complex protein LldG
MNARASILAAVRAARPAGVDLPDLGNAVKSWSSRRDMPDERFLAAARDTGARTVECRRSELARAIADAVGAEPRVVSVVPDAAGTLPPPDQPHAYADIGVFVCEGTLGVAENGAVWLPESRLGCRAGLFLAAHVIIVLARGTVVEHLHDAYNRIDWSDEGFGIFVAGPSKTADIEQAMVIGAHGPVTVTIVLTDTDAAGP